MRRVALALHQFRYESKTFRRDPTAVFFTVVLPVMFLFIFVSIFGNEPTAIDGRTIAGSTYYVPAILTLGLISATFVNLAVSLTSSRERGLLKRVRKTPLPPWAFMAGRIGTSVVVALLLVVALAGIGRLVYGVELPGTTLPGALLAVLVGVASFSALAFAVTAAIPSENAAAPVTNALILPLYFISGVFIPDELIPSGMQAVAAAFPVKNLYEAMLTAFDPQTSGLGIAPLELGIVAAWGLAGAAIAIATFRWAPRSGGG